MAQLVELMIYVKNQKSSKGNTFVVHSTRYNFLNEDGTRTPRYIRVKFSKKPNAFEGSGLTKDDIKRGLLKVEGEYVGCPDKYEIITKEDGTKEYPVCWIRGGIKGFTPIKVEHEFHFDTADVVNDEALEEPVEVQEEQ